MSEEALKTQFHNKYEAIGEYKFYQFIIVYALKKVALVVKGEYKGLPPDLELLDYHDRFMSLYRKEGLDSYLKVAKTFRKAAHKVYRIMLKKQLTNKNLKFLNLV